ncbi:MAG: hypothetical protein ACYDDA_03825 [Acidiferrobacteraceae bacterium]
MNTIKPNPKVNVPGVAGYLLWLRQDLPPVYAKLVQKFPQVAAFDAQLRTLLKVSGLGFDWSSIGSALSGAASSVGSVLSNVGSYVAQNTPAILTTGAGLYGMIAKQQMLDSQLSAAQAGGYPAQTGLVQSPGNQPYLTTIAPTGYGAMSYPGSSFLTSSVAGIPTWILLIAVVGGGVLLLRGR